MCATHSHPALVESVLERSSGFFGLLRHLFGNRPRNQPTDNVANDDPLTPPSGFRNAVICPNLMASMITSGMFPLTRVIAAWTKRLESRSFSKIGNKWSAVMPDGPAAAPRLDFRRQVNNISRSKLNECSGSHLSISWLNPRLGIAGLLSGSVKTRRVACVPGARDAPSRACLAADNSPRLTRDRAQIALLSTVSSRW